MQLVSQIETWKDPALELNRIKYKYKIIENADVMFKINEVSNFQLFALWLAN